MSASLLWIVPKYPWPATDGAKVASFNLLRGLVDHGASIHLVVIAPSNEAGSVDTATIINEIGVNEVTVLQRRVPLHPVAKTLSLGASWLIARHLPLTAASFASRRIVDGLETLIAHFQGDLVVYDGLHCAAHLASSRRRVSSRAPYLYRAHNREALLWARKAELAKQNPALAKFFTYQARAMADFEDSIVLHARGVAPVSDEDRELFIREVRGADPARILTVPIGYEFGSSAPLPPESDARKLLFVGRLDWPPNREGLQWFLEEVWPKVVAAGQGWSLTIAGSGDGRWLEPYRGTANVSIMGFVADLTELYSQSAAAILPLKYGSGTRVKGIEASRYGRVCLSTAVGVEGLGMKDGDDVFLAESASEWVDLLGRLTTADLQEKGRRAWSSLKGRFSRDETAARFLSLIELIRAREHQIAS